jgi:hypothetical protein
MSRAREHKQGRDEKGQNSTPSIGDEDVVGSCQSSREIEIQSIQN